MVFIARIRLGVLHEVRWPAARFSEVQSNNIPCRPKLESFAEATGRIPLVGVIGALVQSWIPLIEDYYYCKSRTQSDGMT